MNLNKRKEPVTFGQMVVGRCYSHPVVDSNKVVVIGSGPAGAVATWELVRAGIDVVLLEAGAAHGARGLTARLAGATVLRFHRPLVQRSEGLRVTGDQGSVLYEDISPGGLTNHWSCAVPRFSPDDFEDARRAGDAFVWPIDYDELSPWYDRVEPLLRIAGSPSDAPGLPAAKVSHPQRLGSSWNPIVDTARLAGQGLLPVPSAYGAGTTLTASGTVFNSFVRLVKPARGSGHLTIRYGARVTRLEWSGDAKRVTGVIARDIQNGVEHRVPCRAVV